MMDHEAVQADFSDYYEGAIPDDRRRAVEAHLAGCETCRGEYASFREALGALSGLKKVPAPAELPQQVADTIHRRSAGRFFGRRAFGDRVPLELLAFAALVLVATLVVLLRWSSTGAVHEPLERHEAPPQAPQLHLPTP